MRRNFGDFRLFQIKTRNFLRKKNACIDARQFLVGIIVLTLLLLLLYISIIIIILLLFHQKQNIPLTRHPDHEISVYRPFTNIFILVSCDGFFKLFYVN